MNPKKYKSKHNAEWIDKLDEKQIEEMKAQLDIIFSDIVPITQKPHHKEHKKQIETKQIKPILSGREWSDADVQYLIHRKMAMRCIDPELESKRILEFISMEEKKRSGLI